MDNSFAVHLILAGLLIGGTLLPPHTQAQRPQTPERGYSESGPTSTHSPRPDRSPAATSLPDWAQPQQPSRDYTDDSFSREAARTKLAPPSEPARNVPIGGGLEYLILSGLAYGAYRLRDN